MGAADLTRQAIVTSTKILVSERPLEKVSVLDIVRHCGINRNTFYYYFKDKYDVMEWIFRMEVEPVLAPALAEKRLAPSVTALCSHMKQEKAFYTNALQDLNHRCLRELLVEYYRGFLMEAAAPHFARLNMDEKSQEVIASFYSHGTIGMICQWVSNGMKMDAQFATGVIYLSAKEQFFA